VAMLPYNLVLYRGQSLFVSHQCEEKIIGTQRMVSNYICSCESLLATATNMLLHSKNFFICYRYMRNCSLGQVFVAHLTCVFFKFLSSSGSPGSRASGRSRSGRGWDNSNSSPHRRHGNSKSSSQRWSPDTSSHRCADVLDLIFVF
jgi:hypothetical protein